MRVLRARREHWVLGKNLTAGCRLRVRARLCRKQKQKQKQKPPNYRVMLHNDSLNKREYVVQVLLKARQCVRFVAYPWPLAQPPCAALQPCRTPPAARAAHTAHGLTARCAAGG